MLVLEPRKRFTISQIKAHKWMNMGEGAAPAKESPPLSLGDLGHNAAQGEFNEQILRLMQSLGIDQQKTIQVSVMLASWCSVISVSGGLS